MTLIGETVHQAQVRKFTRTEYSKMGELGLFEGQRVELIDGEIIVMSPQNNPHRWTVTMISNMLTRMIHPTMTVMSQMPLAVDAQTLPEPDIAVLNTPPEFMGKDHPSTAVLAIEVADSSLARDRKKGSLYARALIPEYWIIDIQRRVIEVYTQPEKGVGDESSWGYARMHILRPGDPIKPTAFTIPAIAVDSLVPKV